MPSQPRAFLFLLVVYYFKAFKIFIFSYVDILPFFCILTYIRHLLNFMIFLLVLLLFRFNMQPSYFSFNIVFSFFYLTLPVLAAAPDIIIYFLIFLISFLLTPDLLIFIYIYTIYENIFYSTTVLNTLHLCSSTILESTTFMFPVVSRFCLFGF